MPLVRFATSAYWRNVAAQPFFLWFLISVLMLTASFLTQTMSSEHGTNQWSSAKETMLSRKDAMP